MTGRDTAVPAATFRTAFCTLSNLTLPRLSLSLSAPVDAALQNSFARQRSAQCHRHSDLSTHLASGPASLRSLMAFVDRPLRRGAISRLWTPPVSAASGACVCAALSAIVCRCRGGRQLHVALPFVFRPL